MRRNYRGNNRNYRGDRQHDTKPIYPFDSLDGLLDYANNILISASSITEMSNVAKRFIETLLEILRSMNIKLTYEPLTCLEQISTLENALPRVLLLLTTNRYKADFQLPLVQQANGIILELLFLKKGPTLQTLVVPQREMNPAARYADIQRGLRTYTIYPVRDGTVLNLYWDPRYLSRSATGEAISQSGRWVWATKNSFDISNTVWRGMAYGEVIADVLSNYKEWSLETLNQGVVYSIGIQHPAHHPFENKKEAWMLTPIDAGLPLQKALPPEDFSTMTHKCQNALQNYLDGGPGFLGYILRATSDRADIIMESTLWKTIRHLIYQMPFIPNKTLRDRYEQNFKNMKYIVLECFLDMEKRSMFVKLFPAFSSLIQEWEVIIDNITEYIYSIMMGSNPTIEAQTEATLVTRFVPILREVYTLQPGALPMVDKKIIKSLLMNHKYTEVYVPVLTI